MNDYELDMDAEGLPDEPVRDPWTYDPPSAGKVIAFAVLGIGALAAVGWVFYRTVR